MKRTIRYLAVALVAGLLLTACSRRGVHMSKHRKSRKCDCPTFAVRTVAPAEAAVAYAPTANPTRDDA